MRATPLLQDLLIDTARRLPDKVALVCGKRRLTYAEIDRRSDALASFLRRRGLVRGDRVVIFADNGPEAAIGFWGVLKADAVVSLVNPSTKAEKLTWLLTDSGASALIAGGRLASISGAAAARAPGLCISVVAGSCEQIDAAKLPGAAAWDEATAPAGALEAPPRKNLDIDLAAVIYTSGSTGDPKGVMLTHRNMLAAAASISSYLGIEQGDVILNVLPLSFDYGLYQMILAFGVGARLVLERSFAYPAAVLGQAAAEGVTVLPGVPTIFAVLSEMRSLAEHDLSHVRFVTNTAAALSRRQIDFLKRAFPKARIFSMYGLTECKRCTYLPPEELDRRPDSVGIAIPNTELWIVDEDGRRLGPGEVGQLVVRGATVMAGYWAKPAETAERLRAGPLPGERVLYTGDLCRLDDEGYLYFIGRMDDIIKSRGEKVAPREVELALAEIPGVREAAVVGVPDEILGHAIKAFVVLETGAAVTGKEIQRACQGRLEAFMVPREIEIVRELPRTDTGKIDKTKLG